ncbi:hypothetical protein RND71_003428 [Anisodus tanguticus]|uniref:Uncharacterized protein n=1 Tax=Anisodus tanguticus TaxID=243964 RepID=A0AAE1SXW3_9SOLA|nr:hypothetical protein RND71_003428 [Anisodus tanguticus]
MASQGSKSLATHMGCPWAILHTHGTPNGSGVGDIQVDPKIDAIVGVSGSQFDWTMWGLVAVSGGFRKSYAKAFCMDVTSVLRVMLMIRTWRFGGVKVQHNNVLLNSSQFKVKTNNIINLRPKTNNIGHTRNIMVFSPHSRKINTVEVNRDCDNTLLFAYAKQDRSSFSKFTTLKSCSRLRGPELKIQATVDLSAASIRGVPGMLRGGVNGWESVFDVGKVTKRNRNSEVLAKKANHYHLISRVNTIFKGIKLDWNMFELGKVFQLKNQDMVLQLKKGRTTILSIGSIIWWHIFEQNEERKAKKRRKR